MSVVIIPAANLKRNCAKLKCDIENFDNRFVLRKYLPIACIVSSRDDFLKGIKFQNRLNWPKDLVFRNCHIIRDVGEDCGLDEEAFASKL